MARPSLLAQARAAIARRDRVLLIATLAAFVLWMASVGPLRSWASGAGVRGFWVFGVAPSFFAGSTLTLWQAFTTRTGAAVSALYGASLVALAEVVQFLLPTHRTDGWDVVAGVMGALLAAPLVWYRARRMQ